jgi:hypothetical protein
MNIDIASIDMVSEVNMVSFEVYGCVPKPSFEGREEEGACPSGWGMCECMDEVGRRAGNFALEFTLFQGTESAFPSL